MAEVRTPAETLFAGHDDEKFKRLLEAAPDAMVIADRQGRIVLVNAQTERLFGYTPGELLGQPVEMLVPESLRQKHVATPDLNSAPSRARGRWARASNFSGAARMAVPFPSKSA